MHINPINQEVIRALLSAGTLVRTALEVERNQVQKTFILPGNVLLYHLQDLVDPQESIPGYCNQYVTLSATQRDLCGAVLSGPFTGEWRQTSFHGADCFGADFNGADVWAAVFDFANLHGASFTGAYGLGAASWKDAEIDSETTMVGGYLHLNDRGAQSPIVEWVWGEDGSWEATLEDGTRWVGRPGGYGQKSIE